MTDNKTAVVLINLGTPDSPSVSDVRRYLFQFLNDPRVIDIPALLRWVLVNLIIVPLRAPKSAKLYKQLWTDRGSPLLFYGQDLCKGLRSALPDTYTVQLAMRYGNPSIPHVLDNVLKERPKKIILFPLFPHYASSSSGSAIEAALNHLRKKWVIPEIAVAGQFFNNPGFIDSWVENGKKHHPETFDHILFSYHGLPERQVDKVYEDSPCSDHHCEDTLDSENLFCYKATCFETTRLIAERLNIPKEKYSVGFQSRLDSKWLRPFSDDLVEKLAEDGIKKLLVFSPAFVADCLETTIEIGHEYEDSFRAKGGEKLQLVESLNANPLWVNALSGMIQSL